MSIQSESMLIAQARVYDQISAVVSNLHQLSVAQVASKVDDIRAAAQSYGLTPVVELARGFEKALAGSLSLMFALPFLEAMRDAVGVERADPAVAQSFLAAINQRLYG